MADSEGTWQIGTDDAATMAATDFGQWAPATEPDLWSEANTKMNAVACRAIKRGIIQLAEIASAERACAAGILLDGAQLLTLEGGAPEAAVDSVRIRRPAQLQCTYDGGVTTTKLYPSLAAGTGSSASNGLTEAVIIAPVAMRLVTVVANCDADLGSTTIEIEADGVAVDSASVAVGLGITVIDFLTAAGAHTIPAGAAVAVSLDPTNAHDVVRLLLEFEEVPT